MDAELFTRLEEAFHEHCVLVFPRQSLDAAAFLRFASRWGLPEPHVIDTFHHPDDANILVLSNVKLDGKPVGLADAGTYFHTDYSYLQVPARCTMVHALEVPESNAGTTFANQCRAYEDLPAAMKQRIESLVVRHHYGNRDDLDEGSRTVASVLSEDQKKKVTWVRHKLVREHPHTGRRTLYAVSGSSFEVEGMGGEEGRALLDELKEHATQPQYCHTHDYRAGDVVMWDNVQLLHRAPLVDFSRPRTLWRITVRDRESPAISSNKEND
jgi:taurine dioxygenase